MKKWIGMGLLGMMLAVCLCACASKGDVSQVKMVSVPSERYSQEEIVSAREVVLDYFTEHFQDCTLTDLAYLGDEQTAGYQDWADRNHADDVIVFLSSFETGANPDITMNKNSTYTRWNWILVRDNGGPWRHVDHGY